MIRRLKINYSFENIWIYVTNFFILLIGFFIWDDIQVLRWKLFHGFIEEPVSHIFEKGSKVVFGYITFESFQA